MNSDRLSDWLGYINSKRPNEKEFGLERLKGVYSELIKKPIAAKTILIAGTNGKGSTAEFLKNFLFEPKITPDVPKEREASPSSYNPSPTAAAALSPAPPIKL